MNFDSQILKADCIKYLFVQLVIFCNSNTIKGEQDLVFTILFTLIISNSNTIKGEQDMVFTILFTLIRIYVVVLILC